MNRAPTRRTGASRPRVRAPTRRERAPAAAAAPAASVTPPSPAEPVAVRSARRSDLDRVIAIDADVTGIEKRSYWHGVFRRYGGPRHARGRFLVAESGGTVVGFVIGEVRDWEFGSPPCGWVFAIDVAPEARLAGVATRLLAAICDGFRRAGLRQVRTLLARDDTLILAFFRSQGMMAAPLIPLEMGLEP